MTARFVGLDEGVPSSASGRPSDPNILLSAKRDAGKPFNIRLDIANTTGKPVSGELRIWLNDDWEIEVGQLTVGHHEKLSASQTIPAHSTNSFFATAIPKPNRVLQALYPVHATFAFPGGDALHPIAVFEAQTNGAAAPGTEQSGACIGRLTAGHHEGLPVGQPLALLPGTSFAQIPGAAPRPVAEAAETGAFINKGWYSADGDLRFGFFIQPPWRTGGGYCWHDIPVSLPATTPLSLSLSTAIRPPLRAGEGRSDGTDYKVFVVESGGHTTEVFSAFVKESSWTDSSAELTPWAGKTVTIRLWNGCGPANDPNYDRCLWGDVGVYGGSGGAGEPPAEAQTRASRPRSDNAPRPDAQALPCAMPLSVRGESWTASIAPGPNGLIDGTISFTDGERTLSFTGFTCAIDDITVGTGPLDAHCTGWEFGRLTAGHHERHPDAQAPHPDAQAPHPDAQAPHPDAQALPCAILHRIDMHDGRTITARATLFADGPALRIRWDMPGTTRSSCGSPRFTRLGFGPCSLPAERAYMGFGNVLERPRSFELTGGLFRNMASHAGADYANGASLVQATDSLPDRILCHRDSNVLAVEASHDATFSFVPSARGAFAAARAWRDVAGHHPGAGWRNAATRMCLDQWGGPTAGFAKAAAALDTLAKYGVTNAVYVRHVWQRWGFDYRLPEIWPLDNRQPHGSQKVFIDLVERARRHGILFVPHDNYIDHYPDSDGFSYDDTVFDSKGAPVKAWFNFNKGKLAQSYRWAPNALMPALRANAAALKDGFAPGGVFIDVFSNMAPWDWFDRSGHFHTRAETRAAWCEAFDEYRRILGTNTVTIGEGGHDELIGHLDAGQPDHFTPGRWMDRGAYADSERVPWHDIVTHGAFALYGGGLGWRYASDSPERGPDSATKGTSSDSYLCTTVIGGRTPSYDFDPFDLRAVTVYWHIYDVCRALALSEFESFEFEGSIHRQHAVFAGGEGGGGQVWVNRPDAVHGKACTWHLPNGLTIPQDGFYAETSGARAGIVEIAGRRCAFSQTRDSIFVDGRPDRRDGTGPADTANASAMADFSAVLHPDAQALPCATKALPCATKALPCATQALPCAIKGIKTDGAFLLQRDADGALLLIPVPQMGGLFRAEITLAPFKRFVSGAPSPDNTAVTAVEPISPNSGATPPAWSHSGGIISLSLDSQAFAYRLVF